MTCRQRSGTGRHGWRRTLVWGLLLLFIVSPGVAWAKDKPDKKSKKKPAAAAAKGSGAAVPDTWYVSSLAEREGGILAVHYWSKGPLFRAETIVEGHRVATIVNGEIYYIIDVVSGTGIAITRSPRAASEDAGRGRPFGREWDEIVRDGGENVSRKEMGGAAYDVFRVTDRSGRREVIVTQTEPRIPVRVESYNRKSGKSSAVQYMNWRRGLNIADAFFEPPARADLARLSYEEYLEKIRTRAVGPAPVLFGELLHGEQER